MSPQEREQLSHFLQQLTAAKADIQDAEAAALIKEACLRQPDAAYLLVQRALMLDHALQGAQAQIARLNGELEQARAAGTGNRGSFLGDANYWGNVGAARSAAAPAMAAPAAGMPAAAPAAASWGSGMLGNIATTAAGVVAGSFLFQGIEHLMGNHGSSWMPSGMPNAGALDHPALNGGGNTTITNNYFGDSADADFDAGALDGDNFIDA